MKDTLCSYYTNSKDITAYMVAQISLADNDVILEPSVGEGVFIDEIFKAKKNIYIDALDIDEETINILQKKYKNVSQVSVRKTDTLLDEQLDYFSSVGGHYTKIIGNPPYGAWQDYAKRNLLKKKYAGQYVKETYSLFLLRCISVLKMHGKLSFIVPDTFLFLNLHSKLRKLLLSTTKIDEILIFPSNFFPGVNFGYSNLSIITLERCEEQEAFKNNIRIIKGFQSSSEFTEILSRNFHSNHLKTYILNQKDIFNNSKSRFIIGEESNISLLNSEVKKLGDVADIVTGFYTGNNKEFIRVLNKSVRGAKGYSIIDKNKVFNCTSNNGINTTEGYIPYIKSASKRRYLRETDEWFVRWDKVAIDFYISNKKSRFQNSSFYFKTGIGIPMVKSSKIRAFLMKDRVFDQSVVGIFPHKEDDLLYFLALMNSEVMNELIHIINPTANNSSNYVKQLPYIEPEGNTKEEISALVRQIIELQKAGDNTTAYALQTEVNDMIDFIYQF